MAYQPRAVDGLLRELVSGLPAVSVEGAKGVGKTATAERLAMSTIRLDEEATRVNVSADPQVALRLPSPILLDEWQLVPPLWDAVRRAVDADHVPGRFILTGSALPPVGARMHSGAGRIVRLVMRPMTLPERGITEPTVSLAALIAGGRPPVGGRSTITLADYSAEIVASGLPGVRADPPRFRRRALASYLASAVEHGIPELGAEVRRPRAVIAWLAAYAAATATTASYTAILDAATPGDDAKPSRPTADAYRELLSRLWLLDPVPAWVPSFNRLSRLGQAPKHHLADVALAASLLGETEQSLLGGSASPTGRHSSMLGVLFESLSTMTLRVFAELVEGTVSHLRTRNGDHEIDIIIERPDHRVIAVEVKLASAVTGSDTKHLAWLERELGDRLVDKLIVNTGPFAHRLPDGTAVVPLGLLGP